jgi:hypothetical protein
VSLLSKSHQSRCSETDPDEIPIDAQALQATASPAMLRSDLVRVIGTDAALVIRVVIGGFSQAEVASKLGLSEAATRKRYLGRAKQAHDELIAAAHRAQADALEIEDQAKRRLADEYDTAQERGEVAGPHNGARNRVSDENAIATTADIGLSRKDIHETRLVRDAEEAEPGIIRRALDERLEAGEEPSKAALRKMVTDAATRRQRGDGRTRNPDPNPSPAFHPVAGADGFGTTVADHVLAENEVVPAANHLAFQTVRTGRPGTLSPTEGSETGRTVPPRNIEMG